MKKLILSLVLIFTVGVFTQANAITEKSNDNIIILVEDCAEEGAMMYEASRNRGLSREASFELAVGWYNDCVENQEQ